MNKTRMYEEMLVLALNTKNYEIASEIESTLKKREERAAKAKAMKLARNRPLYDAIKEAIENSGNSGLTAVSIQWANIEVFANISTHTIVALLRDLIKEEEVEAVKTRHPMYDCMGRSTTANLYRLM